MLKAVQSHVCKGQCYRVAPGRHSAEACGLGCFSDLLSLLILPPCVYMGCEMSELAALARASCRCAAGYVAAYVLMGAIL